jgi:hypothetical protein
MDLELLTRRLLRVVRLDTSVFDEVRMDPTATASSFLAMVVATYLAGLGGFLWWWAPGHPSFDEGRVFFQSFILGSAFSVGLWLVWLLVTYVVLTQILRERSDITQLLRTMGLAGAPLGLSFFLFIPSIDFGVALVSIALLFGLTNVAIQATTTANPTRVLLANTVGFAVWAIVLALLVEDRTYLAPGIFVITAL